MLTALTFAGAALLAATSIVATYLFAIYFCAASGVAAISAAAMQQARIDGTLCAECFVLQSLVTGDRGHHARYRVQQRGAYGYTRPHYR